MAAEALAVVVAEAAGGLEFAGVAELVRQVREVERSGQLGNRLAAGKSCPDFPFQGRLHHLHGDVGGVGKRGRAVVAGRHCENAGADREKRAAAADHTGQRVDRERAVGVPAGDGIGDLGPRVRPVLGFEVDDCFLAVDDRDGAVVEHRRGMVVSRLGDVRRAEHDLAEVGTGPRDREVVAADAFFLQRLDVVKFPAFQRDRRGPLRGELAPFPRVGGVRAEGDPDLVRRVAIGGQPQLAAIVRGDPEGEAAAVRRAQVAAEALAVVVGAVDGRFEDRLVGGGVRAVRIGAERGQVGDVVAADAGPDLPPHGAGLDVHGDLRGAGKAAAVGHADIEEELRQRGEVQRAVDGEDAGARVQRESISDVAAGDGEVGKGGAGFEIAGRQGADHGARGASFRDPEGRAREPRRAVGEGAGEFQMIGADQAAAEGRRLPRDGDVVGPGLVAVEDLDVVALAGGQGDRGGLLAAERVPHARAGIAGSGGDQHLVRGIGIGGQPDLAGIVGGGPEDVVARLRRQQVAAEFLAVVFNVGGRLEHRRITGRVRAVRVGAERSHRTDAIAAKAGPGVLLHAAERGDADGYDACRR